MGCRSNAAAVSGHDLTGSSFVHRDGLQSSDGFSQDQGMDYHGTYKRTQSMFMTCRAWEKLMRL